MEENTLAAPDRALVSEISEIKRKMRFTGSVIKITLAGAIVDIGLEIPGVVHISQLQKDPVNKVEDVVKIGQAVDVWVRRVDPNKGRIDLTMVEPLALEWREIEKGMVIKGKVIRLEKFGAFVDIGAERPGLVHISELTHDHIRTPGDVVKEGDEIEVKVLGVNRRKKQIKLSIKALEEKPVRIPKTASKEKDREVPQETGEKEKPVPTAMEMALREAMERAKTRDDVESTRTRRKTSSQKDEQENILSRTLEQKVKTAAK